MPILFFSQLSIELMGDEAKDGQLMLLVCPKVKELKDFITSVITAHKFLKLNLIAKKLKIKFY